MHSSHAYLLGKEEGIQNLLTRAGEFFCVQLCCIKENLEVTLGNAQIPLEDITELIDDFNLKRPITYDP